MWSSFGALAMLALALLPGALFLWSLERRVGNYGIGLGDRVLRFVGGSAIILAFFATPMYWLYINYWDSIAEREAVPYWLALVPISYVAVPVIVGTGLGYGLRAGWRWAALLVGSDLAPRAWDHLFQSPADGWVRCRLKSGTWLGGAFAEVNGRRSYAAGYPEPQDIYLAASVAVDSVTGEFLIDDGGQVTIGNGGLLLRWGEVEYLEFIHADGE